MKILKLQNETWSFLYLILKHEVFLTDILQRVNFFWVKFRIWQKWRFIEYYVSIRWTAKLNSLKRIFFNNRLNLFLYFSINRILFSIIFTKYKTNTAKTSVSKGFFIKIFSNYKEFLAWILMGNGIEFKLGTLGKFLQLKIKI